MASEIERYKEARDYFELTHSDGGVRLLAHLEYQIRKYVEVVTTKGMDTTEKEHEVLVAIRTLKSVLRHVSILASRYEPLKESLEKQGIKD